ncbi:MAG: hypothetical protein OER88_09735, partial [Planctomycetota bacterium]|nr:hypothetical protein [Planctomycetota bacterium]
MRQMGGLLIVWLVAGCGGGAPGDVVVTLDAAPLVLAAGGVNVMPEAADTVSAGVNLARLGIAAVDAVYEVSTPAGESFRFEALTRAAENAGAVRVSIAHAAEDGRAPAGGVESLAEAGVVPGATGAASRGVWLDTTGDGFARVTIRGAIEKEQIIAVQTAGGEAPQTALICIRIGAPSVINPGVRGEGEYPGILSDDVIYSSDSWRFGLPTVAISGDRTTIVCYEGDLADPHSYARFELRLQHDKTTGEVTGGAGGAPGEDFGHWRDHEIAALFNVLAIAHSGEDGVIVRLSFDRGATFPQENILGAAGTGHPARLVQVAMAADYTLAVVFWRGGGFGPVPARPQSGNELVLVEGRPDAFDGGGSPTSFTFGAPVVLHREATDVSPVVMGAQYSSGGDLVVGYGFTTWETRSPPD